MYLANQGAFLQNFEIEMMDNILNTSAKTSCSESSHVKLEDDEEEVD